MKIIGITGPSGSGKSTLTEHFASLGIPTIDADALYHSMLVPPSECLEAIRSQFGDNVFLPDGRLDRTALSAVVFNDEHKLTLLNKTVLGIVIKEIRKQIFHLSDMGEKAVAVDAPTLIESGFNKECDVVISVLSSPALRIDRIAERDNISKEKAEERVHAQKEDKFYIEASDHIIINSGSVEDFSKDVEKIEKILFN